MRMVLGARGLAAEAAFLVAVAAAAAFLSLPITLVVAVMVGGWLLVAGLEVTASRHASREREPSVEPDPLPEPVSPGELSPTPADPLEALPDGAPPPLAEPVPPAAEPVEESEEGEDRPAEPRGWNLWDLERAVREDSGVDAERAEERGFLLLHLREFAEPDGSLPSSFDALLADSFDELAGSPAR
jgi:hypothetical protein